VTNASPHAIATFVSDAVGRPALEIVTIDSELRGRETINMIYPQSSRDRSMHRASRGRPAANSKKQPRARLVIDFASRSAALSAMRGSKAVEASTVEDHALAGRLVWPRDVLAAHAALLAERGMPIAHVYAAAAAASVDRAIQAIDAAERQEGWQSDRVEDFRAGSLAEWL
jgi:hypothetical protein